MWLLSYSIATFAFGASADIGDKVAVIPVKGMITLEGGTSFLTPLVSGNDLASQIKDADENKNVRAIVLEINSPGGTVLGSKVVADAVKNAEKPVVAVITETGASGGYWIASQADYIIADELSFVGSIGVLGSHLEFAGLLDDFNITYRKLTTGEYKDLGNPYREMTEEEEVLIMQRLDGIHDFFVTEVAYGRNMSEEDISELANGLFYLGYEAKDLGLIDDLGNKDYAIDIAKEIAGITDGSIKEYGEQEGMFDFLKKYTSYSSFLIGQGIGSVLVSQESQFEVKL